MRLKCKTTTETIVCRFFRPLLFCEFHELAIRIHEFKNNNNNSDFTQGKLKTHENINF